MGALSANTCHVSASAAAAAACSTYPQVSPAASAVVTWSCESYTETQLNLRQTSTAGLDQTSTLAVSFSPCDEREGYTDSLEAFGLVAGAIFLACLMRMAWDRIVSPQG